MRREKPLAHHSKLRGFSAQAAPAIPRRQPHGERPAPPASAIVSSSIGYRPSILRIRGLSAARPRPGRARIGRSVRIGMKKVLIELAGAPGFEPGNVDTKNRCLTTWRRPKALRPKHWACPGKSGICRSDIFPGMLSVSLRRKERVKTPSFAQKNRTPLAFTGHANTGARRRKPGK